MTGTSIETILLENDDVRVTRVEVQAGETHLPSGPRLKRVIVSLTQDHKVRIHNGNEQIEREVGEVAFREASDGHAIESRNAHDAVTLLIELKKE